MRRSLPLALGVLLPLSLAASAAAQDVGDRIGLPDGWRPEGVTTDGALPYVGSLADGAIFAADPATGEGRVLVPGTVGAMALGLDVDAAHGRLWVAGGPTGEVRAYDLTSGELLGTYPFEAGFLNDVAVTPDAAYVTDSFVPQLGVVPFRADGSLPKPGKATLVPLTGDIAYVDGAFNANGIVAAAGGLIIVQSVTGALIRVDPVTGETVAIDGGDLDLSGGDGLELDGDLLYVIRNSAGTVTAVGLDEATATATLVSDLDHPDLDVPTTAALLGDDLWVVNARFGTDPEPDTEYWLTRLTAAGEEDGQAASGTDTPQEWSRAARSLSACGAFHPALPRVAHAAWPPPPCWPWSWGRAALPRSRPSPTARLPPSTGSWPRWRRVSSRPRRPSTARMEPGPRADGTWPPRSAR